jgi:hypothetical protein
MHPTIAEARGHPRTVSGLLDFFVAHSLRIPRVALTVCLLLRALADADPATARHIAEQIGRLNDDRNAGNLVLAAWRAGTLEPGRLE